MRVVRENEKKRERERERKRERDRREVLKQKSQISHQIVSEYLILRYSASQ
jgi:hypothetical protein